MTAQAHERLIIDGEETSMAFCPPLPEGHPRIAQAGPDEACASDSFVFSTACWRRYVGTWEIREGRFYLVGIEGIYKLLGDDPLLADWFTGVLRVPRGEMLQYVHMGFGSVFEEELHIKIEEGIVTRSRVISNRDKPPRRRGVFGWTDDLPGRENRFDGDDEM